MRTDGKASLTKLTVDFRNFSKASKILYLKFSNKSEK